MVHFNVSAHPTAPWTAQQTTEAFPFDETPRDMIRDRHSIYGDIFRERVKSVRIGLALDIAGGKMYWTDCLGHNIQRSGLDGGEIEDLVTELADDPTRRNSDKDAAKLARHGAICV